MPARDAQGYPRGYPSSCIEARVLDALAVTEHPSQRLLRAVEPSMPIRVLPVLQVVEVHLGVLTHDPRSRLKRLEHMRVVARSAEADEEPAPTEDRVLRGGDLLR